MDMGQLVFDIHSTTWGIIPLMATIAWVSIITHSIFPMILVAMWLSIAAVVSDPVRFHPSINPW
jgi:hypothetical protein